MTRQTSSPRSTHRLDARAPWAIATATIAALALFLVAGRPVEAAPAPTILSLSPAIGASAGGTVISITGTGFASGATVRFGGVSATSVTVNSETLIVATTPAGSPGAVTVTIQNTDGQAANLGGGYTYQHPAPTLGNIAPAGGTSAGGTTITLTGTGFRAGATVNVGGIASATSVNATTITAVTPPGLVGASAVTVTNTDGQSSTIAGGYTYTAAAAPTVSTVVPASGGLLGGTAVTITGSGFVSGATVSFGGLAASSVTVVNATTITATTPAQSTSGAKAILVSNPDTQSGGLSGAYTYTPLAAPTVSSISPISGPAAGGTTVTLVGTGFVSGVSVTIGGVAASNVAVTSSTTLTAVTPQRSAGVGTVTVAHTDGQSGSLPSGFTAIANTAPSVASVTPNTGTTSGGTPISITGTGFLPNATVTIGSGFATQVTVVSATVITAVTPPQAAGAVAVTVTNYDGLGGTNGTGFTYKANAAPTISAAAPATGPLAGNTSVTITGTNFQPGATVRFGNGYSQQTTVAGTTGILALTPPALAGVAPIVVTNPDGQSAVLSTGFTYSANPAPAITSASPTTGPATGGTMVTITGTGFMTGATVLFGAFTASYPVINPTSIVVTAPNNVVSDVPIIVTNPDGQVALLPKGFVYTAPGAGAGNIAEAPPAGGMSFVVAGTSDLQALMAGQTFKVVAAFVLDTKTQIWRIHVVGAPQNSLTTLNPTDIVVLRR